MGTWFCLNIQYMYSNIINYSYLGEKKEIICINVKFSSVLVEQNLWKLRAYHTEFKQKHPERPNVCFGPWRKRGLNDRGVAGTETALSNNLWRQVRWIPTETQRNRRHGCWKGIAEHRCGPCDDRLQKTCPTKPKSHPDIIRRALCEHEGS